MSEILKELFDKLTRYERYVVLLPGVFFVSLSQKLDVMDFSNSTLMEKFIAVLFFGIISSRIGVVIVEGTARIKKLGIWNEYEDYMFLRENDKRGADMITLNSNWFRSLSGMAILLLIILIVQSCAVKFGICTISKRIWFLIGLIALFVESYVRQVIFMKKRINHFKSKSELTKTKSA